MKRTSIIELTQKELDRIAEIMNDKKKYYQKDASEGELFDRFAVDYHYPNHAISLCVMPYMHEVSLMLEDCLKDENGWTVTVSYDDIIVGDLYNGGVTIPCYDDNDEEYDCEVIIKIVDNPREISFN